MLCKTTLHLFIMLTGGAVTGERHAAGLWSGEVLGMAGNGRLPLGAALLLVTNCVWVLWHWPLLLRSGPSLL